MGRGEETLQKRVYSMNRADIGEAINGNTYLMRSNSTGVERDVPNTHSVLWLFSPRVGERALLGKMRKRSLDLIP